MKRAFVGLMIFAAAGLGVWLVIDRREGDRAASVRASTETTTAPPAVTEEQIAEFAALFPAIPLNAVSDIGNISLAELISSGDQLVDGRLEDVVVGKEHRVTPVLECEGGEIDCIPPVYAVTAEFVLSDARVTDLEQPGVVRDVGEARVRLVVGNANVDREGGEAFVGRLRATAPIGARYVAIGRLYEDGLVQWGVNSSAVAASDGALRQLSWTTRGVAQGLVEASTLDNLRAVASR